MQVYLNGEWTDEQQARVSPFDRGFLFGDGIYEVIPVYGGRCLRLPAHVTRLQRSLNAIRLPGDTQDWPAICADLITRNGIIDGAIYLQVSRAGLPGKREHGLPTQTAMTVFGFAYPYDATPNPEQGIVAHLMPDPRWTFNHIKAISLLGANMGRQLASDAGASEALFVRDGRLLEGSSSNVWWVRDGVVCTPPEQECMLTGITRAVVLDACRAAGVPVREQHLPIEDLPQAGEVWISSSLRELRAVVRIDEKLVGDGQTGPVYRRVLAAFQAIKQRECGGAA